MVRWFGTEVDALLFIHGTPLFGLTLHNKERYGCGVNRARTAPRLVAVPFALLTITAYVPASTFDTEWITNWLVVAPEMLPPSNRLVPFFNHRYVRGRLPIAVTENVASFPDILVRLEGCVAIAGAPSTLNATDALVALAAPLLTLTQ